MYSSISARFAAWHFCQSRRTDLYCIEFIQTYSGYVIQSGRVMTIELDPPRLSWEVGEYTDNPELPDIEDLNVVAPDFFPCADELLFVEDVEQFW